MTLRISTGIRNNQMDAVKTLLADGAIAIYDGVMPSTPDSPANGTLLGYVSKDGATFTHGVTTNGIEFDAASAGLIAKASGETWRMTSIATGTARYGRFVGNPTDDNSTSTTLPRVDISVGVGIGVLQLASVNITSVGQTVDVTAFTIEQQTTQEAS